MLHSPPGPTSAGPLRPQVTVAVVPRETFTRAPECIRSLRSSTDHPFDLLFVDAGYPAAVRTELDEVFASLPRRPTVVRTNHYLTPNQARNLAVRHCATPFLTFVDNDVVFRPGWLDAMLDCATATGAAVVTPLTCQGEPTHTTVHCAGGLARVVEGPRRSRRLIEVMFDQGQPVRDQRADTPRPTELAEFHCMLVRADIFSAVGGLDERMYSTKEHIDFCLAVRQVGGDIYFDPRAVVTYLPPASLTRGDRLFYCLRWNDLWWLLSLRRLARKWRVRRDPGFAHRYRAIGFRRTAVFVKPLLRRSGVSSVPVLGRLVGLAGVIGEKGVNLLVFGTWRLWTLAVPLRVTGGDPAVRREGEPW